MKRLLFVLIVLVGAVPLTLNSLLLLESVPMMGREGRVAWVIAATAAVLVAAAWLVAGRLARFIDSDLDGFRTAIRRLADGDYGWRLSYRGTSSESRDLRQALNRLADSLAEEEALLGREAGESREVAAQSLEFIEELLRARVPLAKHHPGLIESYSRELVARKRQAESSAEPRGFLREVMSAILRRKGREFVRRRSRRFPARTVWLTAPMAAQVTDLSTTGMSIESLESPRGDDPRTFSIVDGDRARTVCGYVKWSKLVSTRPTREGETAAIYRAGIEFATDLPRGTREAILAFVDDQARKIEP